MPVFDQNIEEVRVTAKRVKSQSTAGTGIIRLIARRGTGREDSVLFRVTPELSESSTVNYSEISDIRQPGGLLIYIGTQPRTYQLTARMVSRTADEANLTFQYTHLLKSWTMPNKSKGAGGLGAGGGISLTENAPTVLKLEGYGVDQIRDVPVVITSLGIDYPANVSYIETEDRTAYVPIIQTFNITLKEARNNSELIEFDLIAYKQGKLQNW